MLKYKITTLFILITMICTFTFVNAQEPKLKEKIIYIDPGHGGRDPGAIYKDLKESEINLQISKILKQELESNGAKVYMTRTGDFDLSHPTAKNHKRDDLSERARLINQSECDIFISIHLNSDKSSTWQGPQIFYTTKNKKNIILAQKIQEKINKNLKSDRKIQEIKNMYLFDRIEKPGILIEAGFISNSNDRYLLTNEEHIKKLSKIITESITETLKN